MKLSNFTVTLKDGDTDLLVTKEYKNIFEYGFPADGKFFYMAEKPILSTDKPGNTSLKSHWIPVERIILIQSNQTNHFSSLKERKTFVDSLNK